MRRIFVDSSIKFNIKNRFYLLTLYAKNEAVDLTEDQKRKLKQFMEEWRNEQT